MNSTKNTDFNIYAVLSEYEPSDDILCEDDWLVASIKRVVYGELDETERRIILAYAELGNIRDTAKLFRVSSTTIWYRIQAIRERIKNKLETNGIG